MAILDQNSANVMAAEPRDDIKLEEGTPSLHTVSAGECTTARNRFWIQKLATLGVELRGIDPVSVEERSDSGNNLFSLWFTANCSLLPIATGMSGTLGYGLNTRDSALIILFFSLFATIPVAWMGMLSPKTGMRQMIQTRYSFGMYLIAVVILLQLATLTGYSIITAIVCGQTLSAASGGSLSLTLGIVITAVAGLVVSFMGYKVLHHYENYSWIPTLAAIVITVGYGGKSLLLQAQTEAPSASTVLSFGSIVISFIISWAPSVGDYAVYVRPQAPRIRVFSFVYVGLVLPTVLLLVLGAAIGGAVPNVPSWAAGYDADSTGGVMFAMLENAGRFGKFVAVVLAFSVIGNIACSLYSLSINFQVIIPMLVKVPRYVFSILITAIIIPVSIVIANNFLTSLENFLGVIGYWAAAYIGILLTEHHWFRKGDPAAYDVAIWDVGSKLPMGIAALSAGALSFALIIPCMNEAWYTGPIAETTGDIGSLVGFCLSVLLYLPLRTLEKRLTGR